MSNANASAKKRRAPINVDPPKMQSSGPGQGPGQSVDSPGLTLPQVIALIDKRLVHLEAFVSDSKMVKPTTSIMTPSVISSSINSSSISMDEFNARFEILADEIANMKNIVLSLQSYTMDVNKMLLEERNAKYDIISDSCEQPNAEFIVEQPIVEQQNVVFRSANMDSIEQLKDLLQS